MGRQSVTPKKSIERLRNENEDKTKTQMTQSFNQYSENKTKIIQNILNQFNRVSSSCLRSHFVISLMIGQNLLLGIARNHLVILLHETESFYCQFRN